MGATSKTDSKTRCETADQIVTWEQVQAGDLTIYGGQLTLVDAVVDGAADAAHVCLRFNGHALGRFLPRGDYTAVARYVETTEKSNRG